MTEKELENIRQLERVIDEIDKEAGIPNESFLCSLIFIDVNMNLHTIQKMRTMSIYQCLEVIILKQKDLKKKLQN